MTKTGTYPVFGWDSRLRRTLAQEHALRALHTGIYIGNLWYLNFSDRSRIRPDPLSDGIG